MYVLYVQEWYLFYDYDYMTLVLVFDTGSVLAKPNDMH